MYDDEDEYDYCRDDEQAQILPKSESNNMTDEKNTNNCNYIMIDKLINKVNPLLTWCYSKAEQFSNQSLEIIEDMFTDSEAPEPIPTNKTTKFKS